MRIRGGQEKEDIKLSMTAMIDIVFQLLVFFIMTFKITALEGDFQINMPTTSQDPEVMDFDDLDNTIQVYLQENDQHLLQGMQVTRGEETVTYTHVEGQSDAFAALGEYIRTAVEREGDPTKRKELQVEIEADDLLAYGETVRAIESVSARIDEDRNVVPLIEKINFKDTRK